VRVVLLAFLLVACTTAPQVTQPTPVPTREPNTLAVSVLLDLSGSRAPSGQSQRNAMQLWLDQQRGNPKLNVRFVDIAGSDAKLFVELRRAAIDEHADAVVIGVPTTIDATLAQEFQVAAVPVLLTLPVPDPAATASGKYVFALAPTPDMVAHATAADLIARGRLMPMLIVGDDSLASMVERNAFTAELRRLGATPPTPVIITQADGASRVKSAAAFARSIVLSGATADYVDAIRGMPTGLDAPRVYLSYLTESADLTALRDQQAIVTWPGAGHIVASGTSGAGPSFVRSYTDRHGPPSTIAATAFDALSLIYAAGEAAPNEHDGVRLRLRVEQLTFAGVVSRYSFTSFRHAGFSVEDLTFLEWSGKPVFAPPAKPVTQ